MIDLPTIVDQLRGTLPILDTLLVTVTDADAAWKPAPDRWSIHQAVGHLHHVEVHGFQARIKAMLHEEDPLLESYDPDKFAADGTLTDAPFRAKLEAFRTERAASFNLIATVTEQNVNRPGMQSELGPVTVANLLTEWPLHDLGHIRQIAELIRARKYYPGIGAWQNFYKLNP